MSALFGQTATIYNYYEDSKTGEIKWLRNVVRGVQWMHNRKEVLTANGMQEEIRVESITIDFSRYYGNKPYLIPHEFKKIPADECANYWTLNPETTQDIIVLGEIDAEIKDGKISNFIKDYPYASVVKSVTDNRHMPMLKHIKVVAK